MKGSIIKITVPTLALGLAFAPIANAAPKEATHKPVVSVKVDCKSSLTKPAEKEKAKEVAKKHSPKEKEALKHLTPIAKNLSKVEASVNQLSKKTDEFYKKAAGAPVSVKAEADFFASTSGKLKANTNQLKALKKQVDHLAKKYKNTDALSAAYTKIADLNSAISTSGKNLTDLHTKFTATVKEQEAQKALASIVEGVSKVETSVTELTKSIGDFYAKAAADSSVTVQVEGDFYSKTSGTLQETSKQLSEIKGKLDALIKKYSTSADSTAVDAKITVQVQAVNAAVEALNKFHAEYKPAQPATTNP